jgi:ParB-like nuclease domain
MPGHMSDAMAFCGVSGDRARRSDAVVRVELDGLKPGCRVRVGEVDVDHVRVIALAKGNWPPLIVRRADHTIVDGHYRYRAARMLGLTHVDCIYFDGGENEAFLEALRRNRSHGLPLSLQERERAARHLLRIHSDWSDRRIAEACSVAPGTVGRLRSTTPGSVDADRQWSLRLGRDGRRRPANPEASRRRILSVLETQPDRSLRAIARLTGTSPATVRSVRNRPGPASERTLTDAEGAEGMSPGRPAVRWTSPWASDPALAATTEGKSFARWLEQTNIGEESQDFIARIPLSRVYEVADEARRRAGAWMAFAAMLEGRVRARHQA